MPSYSREAHTPHFSFHHLTFRMPCSLTYIKPSHDVKARIFGPFHFISLSPRHVIGQESCQLMNLITYQSIPYNCIYLHKLFTVCSSLPLFPTPLHSNHLYLSHLPCPEIVAYFTLKYIHLHSNTSNTCTCMVINTMVLVKHVQ